ncbi:MAG TPA: AMP-binding protein [Burkholderiaceae bacterium]|nr:AMP-binding protein [Burkholderiaceae bacterium]
MTVERTEPDTFPKLLLHHAQQRGERPAIREKNRGIWRTTTWGNLADEVTTLATALSARGMQRGARVALVGDNRPRLYAAMNAAQSLGGIVVPLYQDATAEELAPLLQRAEVSYVFAENQEQVDKLLEILPRCPTIRTIVYDQDRGMRQYKQPQLLSYAVLLQQGRELAASKHNFLQAEVERGNASEAAFLFFTPGTTGPSKGVVLTYASLIDRARAAATVDQLKDTDVAMAYLPLGWIGQNLFCYTQPMVTGYCICCPESSETLLSDMREIGPTYFLGSPRVLQTLLAQVSVRIEDAGRVNQALYRHYMSLARRVGARILSGEALPIGQRLAYAIGNLLIYGPLRDVLGMSKLRVAYTGGDAIDPNLVMFFRSLGINLKQLYGSTETGFIVAMQRDGEVKPDTVGPPAQGVELKFTPQGEILVRSPGLFEQYYHDQQTTAQSRTADGWFHTGDVGFLGDDGHLRIVDRMTNVAALSDGTMHAPKLIENKLKFFPYVREAVAFGSGHDRVCMLVDIDTAAVGRWADKQNVSYAGHADLASRDEVYGLIADCIGKVNAELAHDAALARSQVHRFVILPEELEADDGMLTRTGKLRRDAIAERYRASVDAMFEGVVEARTDEIKIRDANTFAPAQTSKAA